MQSYFLSLLNKYLLIVCCLSTSALGIGETEVEKQIRFLSFRLMGESDKTRKK
jgi:hypothetical protein